MEQKSLNARLALQLAAPHTWAASVTPVLLTGAIVYRDYGNLNTVLFLVLLLICILMQSAVNTLNDYHDKISGADTKDDAVEASDAVLVYNDIAPVKARNLAVLFLAAAALLAVYPVVHGGWRVLAIGLTGALIVVLYSAGPMPLSHLPVGEVISGFVMGGLIPLGCYTALTGVFYPGIMGATLPVALGIAFIMLTNNTCDVDKDVRAGRKTLPVLLGRPKTLVLYKILMYAWVTVMGAYIIIFLPRLRTLTVPGTVLAALALIVFHVGMILCFKQARLIKDALKRPKLMKRVSMATFLYGVSLSLAAYCVHLQL